ncbi:MAG: hypothetical protein H6Q14_122 [Bacteroidetes bacterium]|nr:hypothetical protein [Bacteroidota bacterium]
MLTMKISISSVFLSAKILNGVVKCQYFINFALANRKMVSWPSG